MMVRKTKKAAVKKRLVQGRDFDGWAFKYADGTFNLLLRSTKPRYPSLTNGKWVRVRFVEAKP